MKGANIFLSLGIFSLLLVAQPARRCANPYYSHGPVVSPVTKCYTPNPPFKAKLELSTQGVIYATGIVRYGMTIPEIKEALANTGDLCGMTFSISPFELKDNGITYHAPWGFDNNPPTFHGEPFVGKYFTLIIKSPGTECSSTSIIATRQGKAAFICYLIIPQIPSPSIMYLSGDKQTEDAIRKIHSGDDQKFMDQWIVLERHIVNYLHKPHSLTEIQEFLNRLLPSERHAYWKTRVVPFENDDWGTGNNLRNHIYCIRGNFNANKILSLHVDEDAGDYRTLFDPNWHLKPSFDENGDALHAYFNADDELTAVSMRIHIMNVNDLLSCNVDQGFEYSCVPSDVLVFWRVPTKEDSGTTAQ